MTQQNIFRDAADTSRDDKILATSFGGLNTTASSLNIPYSDSPYLLNVDIDEGGLVAKRKGTKVVGSLAGASEQGATFTSVKTSFGLNFIVVKDGTDLKVLEVDSAGNLSTVITKSNVFSSTVENVRPSVVATGENEQRLLFATGGNPIVQLRFVETNIRVSAGGPKTVSIDDSSERFTNISSSNTLMYFNDTRVISPTFSYDGVNNEIDIASHTYSEDTVVTVVYITWQWWAEAELYYGDRFYQNVLRYNTDDVDIHVAVPASLRDGVEYDPDVTTKYRIYAAHDATSDGGWDTMASRPTTATEYALTNGASWDTSDNNDKPIPAPTFVSYGALEAAGKPSAVHMCRARRMNFNGGKGVVPANLSVYIGDSFNHELTNLSGSGGSDDYRYTLHDESNWNDSGGTVIPPTVAAAYSGYTTHIMFRGGTNKGVPPEALVWLINKGLPDIGTGASSTWDSYVDGAFVPAFGFSLFCDYYAGTFPSVVSIYRNRVVFGGFASDPLLLLFSSQADSTLAGEYYAGFIVDSFSTNTNDAFDFRIKGSANDYITATAEYGGSLFVFTREQVLRLRAQNSVVALNNVYTELVGSVGAVNNKSVVAALGRLLFLSDDGVYDVVPTEGLQDNYTLAESSTKIRETFKDYAVSDMEDRAMLVYDTLTQKVYLPLYNENSDTDLFVLMLRQNAWTQYASVENFSVIGLFPYRSSVSNRFFCIATMVGTTAYLLQTEYEKYIDFANEVTNAEWNSGWSLATPQWASTTIADLHKYKHPLQNTGNEDVEDLSVTYNGSELTFQTQWYKQGPQSIWIAGTVEGSQSLVVKHKNPETGLSHVAAYLNNVLLEETTEYTITDSTHTSSVNLLDSDNYTANDTVIVGCKYQAHYRTPSLSWGRLSHFKRGMHWYGMFDNRESLDLWGTEDLVTGQSAYDLVGWPKVELDCNVSFVYNHSQSGETQYDLYRASELIWDWSQFDTLGNELSEDEYILLKEPIQGIGYHLQVWVWSWDEKMFRLAGYQVVGKRKGQRYITR